MKTPSNRLPLLGLAAYSGTGKTTLLRRLIPLLKDQGIRVAIIKHTHHDPDIDQPGKDSYELRRAGAAQTLLASPSRWSLINENVASEEPGLDELIEQLDATRLDLVLIEGFKYNPHPKIELHRSHLNHPLLFPHDSSIIALATDQTPGVNTSLPVLDLNEAQEVAGFVIRWLNKF